MSSTSNWQFWVDRGGTFTDIVASRPDGKMQSYKLLSENPQQYQDAATEGIRRIQSSYQGAGSDAPVSSVKMGTTVATNALLERKGEPTVLLISKGLRDQLEIGYQTRPDIFAQQICKAAPLYQAVYEVPERVLADGTISKPLNRELVYVQLKEAYDQGYRSVAIALMHSYRYPQHEQDIAEIAAYVGFTQISLSHQISPLIKLVPRGETTVADAYLSPVLRQYIQGVESALNKDGFAGSLEFMQSNGGLTQATAFQGRDAILSGPAGGVVGMVKTAQADGFNQLIGFDMGGTSTDVSHYSGEDASQLERETETLVSGVRLRVPMMNIHTVAAGGGSIVHFSDGRLQVGPESAGAYPGPACYRNGGPLTITDCNLLLGRIQPEYFPHVFGPDQDQPLDQQAVKVAFDELVNQVNQALGQSWTAESLAEAFLTLAVESMAAAVKKISVQRGYDIQDYVLNAFGGAGGQHACAVAAALGMKQVYLHPMAGVLSAYGIGLAEQRWLGEQAIEVQFDQDGYFLSALEAGLNALRTGSQSQTHATGQNDVAAEHIRLYLRYQGSDTPLLVDWHNASQAQADFEQQHKQLYGFYYPDKDIVLDAVQLERVQGGRQPLPFELVEQAAQPIAITHLYDSGRWVDTPIYRRSDLGKAFVEQGPLLISDDSSTHFVPSGWGIQLLASGALLIEQLKQEPVVAQPVEGNALVTQDLPAKNPMMLEIFNHLFMSVAEQMGRVLEKTASSVNIKERLDFSCALFDQMGELVANAPHIPVHLGSMSESIQVVIKDHPDIQPGDAFVLNTPYNGGTHLPDVTVVKPVFLPSSTRPDFYVAARGHHADIGGITPGSMPANSQHIEEEGVLLDNLVLMRDGQFQEESLKQVLLAARYPARNPEQNIADLMAQLAACEKGAQELERICQQYGARQVHAYMQYVQDNAEQTLRECLSQLASGQFEYDMDDGSHFAVSIQVDQKNKTAVVDFSCTGYRPDQLMHPVNFNAPTSVVRAAVLYSFRLLVDKPVPLNAGFLRALEIRVPEASMIAPQYPAAVVSGNVETAQYLVDCLMGALGLMAGGQGTNNNFTFGDQDYQYYETLCGGAGATSTGAGASAVHTHMTNSRLTDPEVLEQRYPVVLDLFHIRPMSGGKGKHQGGQGVERHIRFLQPMTANIISGHRKVPTFGLAGGEEGKTGVNFVLRAEGRIDWLASSDQVEMKAGDTFCVHTPGGGGYGEPEA